MQAQKTKSDAGPELRPENVSCGTVVQALDRSLLTYVGADEDFVEFLESRIRWCDLHLHVSPSGLTALAPVACTHPTRYVRQYCCNYMTLKGRRAFLHDPDMWLASKGMYALSANQVIDFYYEKLKTGIGLSRNECRFFVTKLPSDMLTPFYKDRHVTIRLRAVRRCPIQDVKLFVKDRSSRVKAIAQDRLTHELAKI